jgi:hypothetical protein
MVKVTACPCLLVWLFLLPVPLAASGESPPAEFVALSNTVVDQLSSGKMEELVAQFDATMKNGLPAAKLKDIWQKIQSQAGAFQRQTGIRYEKVQAYDTIFVTCQFEKAALDIKIVWNAAREVAGLFFQPVATPGPKAESATGLEGYWQGTLQAGMAQLRLLLKVTRTDKGELVAKVDSLDQGANDLPVTKFSLEGSAFHLEMGSLGASFDGTMNGAKSEIAGQWQQGGQSLPLILKRVGKPTAALRPQEPKKPYPYREEEVTFENKKAGIKLAGTLTVPVSGGPFPAVLLISGSGPQDRDETVFGHHPFLVLADHLTRRGIAVLRVDDRGVGKSQGSMREATSEDFATDVLAGVEFLTTRKEVNPRQIGLLGHSEGALIAPMAAIQSRDVAFLVLLAGTALPGEQILIRQGELISRAMGASEETIRSNRAQQERLFAILQKEPDPAAAESKLRQELVQPGSDMTDGQKKGIGPQLEGQLKMLLSPWFRFFLTYDPAPTLSKVTCPVLALNGEKDLQVPAAENLAAIEKALRAGGNPRHQEILLTGLNHLFQTCQTGSLTEYAKIEETMAPAVLQTVTEWIRHEALQP